MNKYFEELANVGWKGEECGRDCLSYSENEDFAHEKFREMGFELQKLAKSKGQELVIDEDPFGNSYLTLVGVDSKSLVLCSHLDSVPEGGKYDGVLGVASGLEVLRRFVELGKKPTFSLQIVATRSEESSATKRACFGSAMATGNFDLNMLPEVFHEGLGKSMVEVFEDRGVDKEVLVELAKEPFIKPENISAVIELHSEQSSILESMDEPLAVIIHGIGGAICNSISISHSEGVLEKLEDAACITTVSFRGRADHSAGTPMNGEKVNGNEVNLRKDAFVGAMKLVRDLEIKNLVSINIPAEAINKVPGLCEIKYASCSVDEADKMLANIVKYSDGNKLDLGIESDYELSSRIPGLYGESKDFDTLRIREEIKDSVISIVSSCEEMAEDFAIKNEGKVRSTIPTVKIGKGTVELGVDLRMLDNELGREFMNLFTERIGKSVGGSAVEISLGEEKLSKFTPFVEDKLQNVMRRIYKSLFDVSPVEFGLMPGHDAAKFIRAGGNGGFVPGAMIAVRSLNGGVSHNPDELCSEEDIEKGDLFLFEIAKEICY
ncbi:M20/M25/M40 family metallo-hydrolase [Patescibacteria group bacterium]|nr:M20/M25/M40 family metallo-hydrolase [Patescibacteria group bacterium]